MKWISVKDRLPTNIFEYVFVYDRKEGLVMARCGDSKGVFEDKERFYTDVTHWIPLPEPPEI